MPEQQIPATAEFSGMNRRMAPNMLPSGVSPDCRNCRPYNGLIGRLGPRKGRVKLSSTAYASAIVGFWIPPNASENMMVAIDDASSVTIVPEAAPWSGGVVWAGPTLTTINKGFYKEQALATAAVPHYADSGVIAVPVNGATKAISTNASILWATTGTLQIYATFDGGVGRKLMAELFAEYSNTCCSGGDGTLTVTNTTFLVDITGASNLTRVEAESIVADGDGTVSGSVTVMGMTT